VKVALLRLDQQAGTQRGEGKILANAMVGASPAVPGPTIPARSVPAGELISAIPGIASAGPLAEEDMHRCDRRTDIGFWRSPDI
jgi:hypothetical protein